MSNKKGVQLYLNPEECKFLSMAVVATYQDIKASLNNPDYKWKDAAVKNQREMLAAGGSLRIKLEKLGFNMDDLPPVTPDDYN